MAINRRTFIRQSALGALQFGVLSELLARDFSAPAPGQLPRSTPEAQRFSADALLHFLDAVRESNLHSLMVVKNGHVIAEGWWAPYAPELKHTLYSLSKSFTSTAIGLAVGEGKLAVTDKVASFFPDKLPENKSENLAEMNIHDLLTMSSGHDKDTVGNFRASGHDDWVKVFLSQPVAHKPGTHFVYNSGATYMLSAILEKITGQRLSTYLKPRLFDPLHITDFDWETDPNGIEVGGWGLRVKTEDIAKFGQLYLQQGQWNNKAILPAEWIKEASTAHIMQPGKEEDRPNSDWLQGYGYQFWRCRHNGYRGDGAFGQYCIVLPEQNMVIAITSETSDMQSILNQVWKHLLATGETSGNPGKLKQKLKSLALPVPAGQALSPLREGIDGAAFKTRDNTLGIESVSFDIGKKSGVLKIRDKRGEHRIPFGINQWQDGKTGMAIEWAKLVPTGIPGNPSLPTRASGFWVNDATLSITCRFIDTAHYIRLECHFEGEKLRIDILKSIALIGNDAKPYEVIEGEKA